MRQESKLSTHKKHNFNRFCLESVKLQLETVRVSGGFTLVLKIFKTHFIDQWGI